MTTNTYIKDRLIERKPAKRITARISPIASSNSAIGQGTVGLIQLYKSGIKI